MIKAPFKRKSTAVSNGKGLSRTDKGATSQSSSSVNSKVDVLCNGLENAANVYTEIDVNDFLRTKTDNSVDDISTNPDELNFIECLFSKNDLRNNFFELSNDEDKTIEKTAVVHDYINTCTNAENTNCESRTFDGNENRKNNQIDEQNLYDIDSCSSCLQMQPINELMRTSRNSRSSFSECTNNLMKNKLSANVPTRTMNALLTTIKAKIIKQEEKTLSELDSLKNTSDSNSDIKNNDKSSKSVSDSLNDKNNPIKLAKRLKSKLKSGFKFNFSRNERICSQCSKNWSDNYLKENCCCPHENSNDHDHIDDSRYVNEHTYSEIMDVSKNYFHYTKECLSLSLSIKL